MADSDAPRNGAAPPVVRILPSTSITPRRPTPSKGFGGKVWLVLLALGYAVVIVAVGNTRPLEWNAPTVPLPAPAPLSELVDSWTPSTPEEQGIDSGKLADLVERAVATGWIDSVTVVRHGRVVLDTVIFPFPEEALHSVGSSTHSMVSTLLGIAVDQGLLAGVSVPVLEILPDRLDTVDQSLTVEHLLTMSAGLECEEPTTDILRPLWLEVEEPGVRFEHCDRSTSLLSAILSEVTGMPTSEFAAENLFSPLGITDFSWEESTDRRPNDGGELAMLPSDMAKVGHLYLRAGVWDGEQIVSPEWIEIATAPQFETADSVFSQYGYGWYIYAGFIMSNRGDQSIVVIPELDVVVAFASGLPPTRDYVPETLITQYLLAAIRPDPPRNDPSAQARLDAAIAAARSGPEPVDLDVPDTAGDVSNARYRFRPNDVGLRWFRVYLDDDVETLEYETDLSAACDRFPFNSFGEQVTIPLGINGRFLIDEGHEPTLAWRGKWTNYETLMIEYRAVGSEERGTIKLTFDGDTAHLELRNSNAGTVLRTSADRSD